MCIPKRKTTKTEDKNMKATYSKQTGNYRITLTRKEAEALAYNFTSYSILLTPSTAARQRSEATWRRQ